jgi:hypothetical protein
MDLSRISTAGLIASAVALGVAATAAGDQTPDMTFFVTSVGKGNGANLGGLEGADAHCAPRARPGPAGAPTSPPPRRAARPGSTRATASARARGGTPWA